MKLILTLLILFVISSYKLNCEKILDNNENNNYCKKFCQYNRKWVKLYENFASDKSRSSVELPHCGLKDFSDRNNNEFKKNTRIIDGFNAEDHEFPWIVTTSLSSKKWRLVKIDIFKKKYEKLKFYQIF
jgi:hypothetical protein